MMTRRSRRSRGQALVEFAFVFPLFLLLLFGFIDVGRYVYSTIAYGQAVREGARWGSVEQWSFECPVAVSPKTREACIENVTLARIPAGAPTPSTVAFVCPATCRAGDVFSVRVEGQFRFFTPVISNLLGTPVISQTAQVVIQ